MGGVALSLFPACACACEAVSQSLLSAMWLWPSIGLSEMMFWILLACVPLIDVVSTAAVSRRHWGTGPRRPQELNREWWGIEPRSGHRRDYDLPQRFQPWQPRSLSEYAEPPVQLDRQVQDEQPQLAWKYPEQHVEPHSEVPDDVQLVMPVMVPHLALKCGKNTVKIEVQKDMWGNGNFIDEDDLTLGGCSFTEFDRSANVISFEYKLEQCNKEKLVWSFYCFFTI